MRVARCGSLRRMRVGALSLAIASALAGTAQAATYELNASPSTTHISYFDATQPPVLTIESGDKIKLKTTTGNPRYFEKLGVPKDQIPAELYEMYANVEGTGRSDHTLNGPIYVKGAEPGDSLEIRIISVDVRLPIAGQSFRPGGGTVPDEFPYQHDRVLWIDLKNKTVEYAPGVKVPVKAFWGVMGTAPTPDMGRVKSSAPNFFGGNMDNRHLTSGTTLYLPVNVPGGLLSIGDGHAAQGDGEVSGSAIETSLKGEIQVILHKQKTLKVPRAETPTQLMAMGLSPDLDEAARIATSQMLDFIVERYDLTRETAYLLCSAAMDLSITQNVDGTKGVHATIDKSLFGKK